MEISSISNIKNINQVKLPFEPKNIGISNIENNGITDEIKKGLESVQKLQDEANDKIKLALTDSSTDPSEAIISMVKAEISMQLTLNIRNRLIDAYQEINKMSI
jgi:flagellar hook-basal body complex protein FliE